MMAMERGINVYCEKPLCHDIAEARRLREAAHRHKKVATQMGIQGHCEEGYRRLCEYIWAGMIGNVTETHSWSNKSNGGVGPRPPAMPVPPRLHWDSWIGPAPYRDYHTDLHPHEWHGWYDFGNGTLGNMGCHVLDGVFWALKIEHPESIEAEMIRGGTGERYPTGSRVRWDVPARDGMAPLKVYWYEGLNATTTDSPKGTMRTVAGQCPQSAAAPGRIAEAVPGRGARHRGRRNIIRGRQRDYSHPNLREANAHHPDGKNGPTTQAAQNPAEAQGRFCGFY